MAGQRRRHGSGRARGLTPRLPAALRAAVRPLAPTL